MKAKTTWVLVADGARARGFARHGTDGSLVAIPDGTFVHEVERVSAMGVDRPGRVRESADTAHHAIAPHVDWRREGKRGFAHSLAEWLEDRARHRAFDHLVLVAAPRTLGDLRAALGTNARERLAGELAKDLTAHPAAHIEEHLRRAELL
jgi:protein required for attachment to host cells